MKKQTETKTNSSRRDFLKRSSALPILATLAGVGIVTRRASAAGWAADQSNCTNLYRSLCAAHNPNDASAAFDCRQGFQQATISFGSDCSGAMNAFTNAHLGGSGEDLGALQAYCCDG